MITYAPRKTPQRSPETFSNANKNPLANQGKRKKIDEITFAEDLALLLESGVSLRDSLRALYAESASFQWLAPILADIERGETPSSAFQQEGTASPLLVASIRASEKTGDVALGLRRFAKNTSQIGQLRDRLMSALTYPAVLVVAGTLVTLFLLAFVIPRFASLLEASQQPLPWASLALMHLGSTIARYRWILGIASLSVLAFFILRARQHGPVDALDLMGRLPLASGYVHSHQTIQALRSVAMLVRAGTPVLPALEECAALWPASDRQALHEAVAQARAGHPLSSSLQSCGLVGSLGHRMLAVAEQTGAMEMALERLADAQALMLERAMEKISRLIEPVLMLVVGLVVGGIVVLMYMPIFQLASSLQ
jgi:general secretion pathway protein F